MLSTASGPASLHYLQAIMCKAQGANCTFCAIASDAVRTAHRPNEHKPPPNVRTRNVQYVRITVRSIDSDATTGRVHVLVDSTCTCTCTRSYMYMYM